MQFIQAILSNIWSVFLITLFFGGSIFVHELGHFLAARWRGMKVLRFSIGFGPKIFGWRGKDGVEYRLSWIPLGGYVALPQLADMAAIEGEDDSGGTAKLPPAGYLDKVIVAVAGAVFNVLFAFALACVLWPAGRPSNAISASTQIGYVVPVITTADGREIPSPAAAAGLRPGDIVRAIDGHRVGDWEDIMQFIMTSSGRAKDGTRETRLSIERDGARIDVLVHPRLAGEDNVRMVGISPGYELIVARVTPGSAADTAGLRPGDRLKTIGGARIFNDYVLSLHMRDHAGEKNALEISRDGKPMTLEFTLPAAGEKAQSAAFGLDLTVDTMAVHTTPAGQFSRVLRMTWQGISSLVNPKSDIGLSKLSGPIGILHLLYEASRTDIRYVIWITIIININLAILNLLPLPVLDGGHITFATIAKLRGKPIPPNFIATAQGVFMILLLTMVLYVSFFDTKRVARNVRGAPPPAEKTENK